MTGTLEREERAQDLALARAIATGLDRFLENTRHVVDGLAAEVAERQPLPQLSAPQDPADNAAPREPALPPLTLTPHTAPAPAFPPPPTPPPPSNLAPPPP